MTGSSRTNAAGSPSRAMARPSRCFWPRERRLHLSRRFKLLEEISAQELHERCADRLNIAVDDREKYAALLAKHFPEESWRVLPEGTIQIRGFRREPEAYSRRRTGNAPRLS